MVSVFDQGESLLKADVGSLKAAATKFAFASANTHAFRVSGDNVDVDKLTLEFLAESFERLDRMERCLTELEARPGDARLVGEIFRAVHTIKGTTGFLGHRRLERLAHTGEHLLSAVRSGRLQVTSGLVSGLLQLMDALRAIVSRIAKTGFEGEATPENDGALLASLQIFMEMEAPAADMPWTPGNLSLVASDLQEARAAISGQTVRVNVDLIDRMMDLVGELVITRNQLLQEVPAPEHAGREARSGLARRLDLVTTGLRETVMQVRMQPVSSIFEQLPRLVRDLAFGCGKSVRLEMTGQHTRLDRNLLEAIKDPLIHALRNAVDHGIERPAARVAMGKPAYGTIRLSASHGNGWVVIQLEDDGAGIDLGRVRSEAFDQRWISAEQLDSISDQDALRLTFLPGLSTAREITQISGRGVGMDVVKSNLERVGGQVELESCLGTGTLLRMRVPLTAVIVPALLVSTRGEILCLPQSALTEVIYVPRADAVWLIETVGDAKLFRLHAALVPVLALDDVLGMSAEQSPEQPGFYLALMEVDGRRFGLAVDRLEASEEIVVKPLSSGLKETGIYSGATVLGSGAIAMVLDVAELARRAGTCSMAEQDVRMEAELTGFVHAPSFVIYEGRRHERIAMPVEAVDEIISVRLKQVEDHAGRMMLRHGDALLALEDASELLIELEGSDADREVMVLVLRQTVSQEARGMVIRGVFEIDEGLSALLDQKIPAPVTTLFNLPSFEKANALADDYWQEVA